MSRASGPLTGKIAVPGDKSISHRAALFALIADGPCHAVGWLDSDDTRASLRAVETLGARATLTAESLTITPPASPPSDELTIDCGNSGTTARLLTGILAGWLPTGAAGVVLEGDASLSGRPMNRIVDPLRAMGADISWCGEAGCLPFRVRGAELKGVRHELSVASAQVKSALLLAGLFAAGRTTVAGSGGSRDHTELMLHTMGVSIADDSADGSLSIDGPARCGGLDIRVPGDPSSAAFFHAAAALVPGSTITTPGLSLNYTRTGFLRVLRKMGATVAIERPSGPPGGEPLGDVKVSCNWLQKFELSAADIPALVDEIPVLAVLATQVTGRSRITGAADLRVKESDRLAMMATNLNRLGAEVKELPDGLEIAGPTNLVGGPAGAPVVVETAGDHRIAMAMTVAGLVAKGETVLDDEACVAVSYPYFFKALDQLL